MPEYIQTFSPSRTQTILNIKFREENEETREENSKFREETEKTREKILDLLGKQPFFTAAELAKELSITEKAVEWQIKQLKEKKIIKRIGPNKGGHWEIINPGDKNEPN